MEDCQLNESTVVGEGGLGWFEHDYWFIYDILFCWYFGRSKER